MSLGLRTGNSSLKFKQSAFDVQLHLRRESLEWQVYVGKLSDLSPDTRSAGCNWSPFHSLSYLFVWQSLDSQRQSIDLRFKDMKNMLFSNRNSTNSVSLTHCKLYR